MSLIVIGSIGAITSLCFIGWGVSLNNQEIDLRTSVEAKMQDNKQQLAKMKNMFEETAGVASEQVDALTNIFVKYAQARGSGGGSLAKSITEAMPNIDIKTLDNLQNIIESGRNSWAARQTELIDLNRAHTTILREFPGNILFGMLGRKEMAIIVVSSDEAQKAFDTGVENATNLFPKNNK